MSDDFERFRKHAAECRQLAESALDPRESRLLKEIADDLEAEADMMEAEARFPIEVAQSPRAQAQPETGTKRPDSLRFINLR